MTGWEPTTEAEVALRGALHAGDQEQYFRILSRTELLLPVAVDTPTGQAPLGWGTWTADDRTHLLSFTSIASMKACLAEHAGTARRVPFQELAAAWPNHEWWLAVNPGLPIEGYLPAWFISQMVRGDVRLPGAPARGRLERLEALERAQAARATAPVPIRSLALPNGQPMIVDAEVILEDEPEPTDPAPAATARFGQAPIRAAAAAEPAESAVATPTIAPAAKPPVIPTARVEAVRGEPALTEPALTEPALTEPALTEPAMTAPAMTAPALIAPALAEPVLAEASPSVAPASAASAAATSRPAEPSLFEPRPAPEFSPANSVEAQLMDAADAGNTDAYLSTLLLATVLLPVPAEANGARPGDDDFVWQPTQIDGEPHLVCYTSAERMASSTHAVPVRFIRLISAWPDPSWSVAVNPGTPVGAVLPGGQLLALASWAAESGLGVQDHEATMPGPVAGGRKSSGPEVTVMQKAIAPSQAGYYLERGYDRVSGFVHRARELGQLRTPDQLRRALGLNWDGSPFKRGDGEIYLLRWSAYRPSLYRIPYGGQNETAMRAMEGWVIERAPFRGNGFAPGESDEIIAEFKVDSVRLPHGARLLRINADGTEEMVAVLDADGPRWLRWKPETDGDR